jgi:hypothetical protein
VARHFGLRRLSPAAVRPKLCAPAAQAEPTLPIPHHDIARLPRQALALNLWSVGLPLRSDAATVVSHPFVLAYTRPTGDQLARLADDELYMLVASEPARDALRVAVRRFSHPSKEDTAPATPPMSVTPSAGSTDNPVEFPVREGVSVSVSPLASPGDVKDVVAAATSNNGTFKSQASTEVTEGGCFTPPVGFRQSALGDDGHGHGHLSPLSAQHQQLSQQPRAQQQQQQQQQGVSAAFSQSPRINAPPRTLTPEFRKRISAEMATALRQAAAAVVDGAEGNGPLVPSPLPLPLQLPLPVQSPPVPKPSAFRAAAAGVDWSADGPTSDGAEEPISQAGPTGPNDTALTSTTDAASVDGGDGAHGVEAVSEGAEAASVSGRDEAADGEGRAGVSSAAAGEAHRRDQAAAAATAATDAVSAHEVEETPEDTPTERDAERLQSGGAAEARGGGGGQGTGLVRRGGSSCPFTEPFHFVSYQSASLRDPSPAFPQPRSRPPPPVSHFS